MLSTVSQLNEQLEQWLDLATKCGLKWVVREPEGLRSSEANLVGAGFDKLASDLGDRGEVVLSRSNILVWKSSDKTTDALRAEFESILTKRESEVLGFLLTGRPSGEIGMEMGISTRTVEKHLESIRRKAGVSKTREIITLFAE